MYLKDFNTVSYVYVITALLPSRLQRENGQNLTCLLKLIVLKFSDNHLPFQTDILQYGSKKMLVIRKGAGLAFEIKYRSK